MRSQQLGKRTIFAVTPNRQVRGIQPKRILQIIKLPAIAKIENDEIRPARQAPDDGLPTGEKKRGHRGLILARKDLDPVEHAPIYDNGNRFEYKRT